MGKKGSVLKSRGFDITFTLGKFRLLSVGVRATYTGDQGWAMLLATAACLIIRRHRRRLVRLEATAVGGDRVDSQSTPQQVDMRSESTERYHGALPHVAPSGESRVRQPPPVYVPARGSLVAKLRGYLPEFC